VGGVCIPASVGPHLNGVTRLVVNHGCVFTSSLDKVCHVFVCHTVCTTELIASFVVDYWSVVSGNG